MPLDLAAPAPASSAPPTALVLPQRAPFTVARLKGILGDSRIHIGLDAALYHADVHIQSCSQLKAMLESPAHYKAQFLARRAEATKSMDLGTLVHTLVLEPGTFARAYAIYTGKPDARSAEYKAFCAANPNRTVIDEATFAAAKVLTDKVLCRLVQGRPFGDYVAEGLPEVSIYYTDPWTGLVCRCRIDLLHPEITFDLKTTIHPHADAFMRHGLSLHYDLQAYMYSLAVSLLFGETSPRPFKFITAESSAPYSVSALTAGASFMENGGIKYKNALTGVAACLKVNHWPDASTEDTLEIAPWQAAPTTLPWSQSMLTA